MEKPPTPPILPEPAKAHAFFAALRTLCDEHGFLVLRTTWETPDHGFCHFAVQISAPVYTPEPPPTP